MIPCPEQTPEALRATLAVVAPSRLKEMQATKDDAFAQAVEWRFLSPYRAGSSSGPGRSRSPAALSCPHAEPGPTTSPNGPAEPPSPPGRPPSSPRQPPSVIVTQGSPTLRPSCHPSTQIRVPGGKFWLMFL